MPGLKQNPTFSALTDVAYSFGKSLPTKVATNDYQNLSNVRKDVAQQNVSQQTPNNYEAFNKLGTMTTPYGGSTNYEKFHPGVDIAAPTGTEVPAFAGGTVTDVRTNVGRTSSPSYGNYVIVTDPSGQKHRYSHLSQSWVKVGDTVQSGQRIGAIGATGSVYSQSGGDPSHLDYRITDAYNKYVNPSQYLAKL